MSLTQEILSQLNIVDVISRYIKLKKNWTNYVWNCPFHNEKTPSFTVSEQKQIFKCFWCWIGWNAIKFLMEYEKIDFKDCLKLVSQKYWVSIKDFDSYKVEKSDEKKEIIKKLNQKTNEYFIEKLYQNKLALDYLRIKRKLDDQILNLFKIWYASESFTELIDYLKKCWFDSQSILDSWVWIKWKSGDIMPFFRNRIMFPIIDWFWNIVWFAWRVLDENDSPKYLNIWQTILYDKSNILYWMNYAKNYIKQFDELIIVEWYMDVIWLYRANFPIWVASCGTSLTDSHIKNLKRFTSNIWLFFDQDNAWFEATLRWMKICFRNDIFPKIFSLDKQFKDIDEYVNSFQNIIDSKINFDKIEWFDFIIEKLKTKYDSNSTTWRKSILDVLYDIMSNINDKNLSVLDFYVSKISEKLMLNKSTIEIEFFAYLKNIRNYQSKQTQNVSSQFDSDDKIFISLFYKDYLHTYLEDYEIYNLTKLLLNDLISMFEDVFLKNVLENELNDEEATKLLENQMYRDRIFDNVSKKEIKKVLLKKILDFVNEKIKLIVKIKNLDEQSKNNLLTNFNKYYRNISTILKSL